MSQPPIGDDERRRLVADAATTEGLERTLARLHAVLRDSKQQTPGVQGAFQRMLEGLDDGLEPDHTVARLVDRYRRGVIERAELLAHPEVASRLRDRFGGVRPTD